MLIRNLILIAVMAISMSAYAVDCNKHSIYCQIKKNHKKINSTYAMELSNVIYKATKKHQVPPRIFTAILMQESGYSLEAQGCHKGLALVQPNNRFIGPTKTIQMPRYKEIKVCSDFGIGQVWFKTAKSYGFDIKRLNNDLEYSVNSAAIVLAGFKKRYERKEVDWWTRYNARTQYKRDIYKSLVSRYF